VQILRMKQGSADWHAARLGIPTASNFERILTPAKLERSTQARTYLYELLSEWITGLPHGAETATTFMQRGTQLEPQAASWYEYEYGVDTEEVGIVLSDDGMVGCSPDRLVGDEGGLEIKCPSASVHVRYLVEGLKGYTSQVQGALWLTGRKWWDLVAWHPELPAVVVRHQRDERYIAALDAAMREFVQELQEARSMLLARGCTPAGLRLTPALMVPGDEPF